MRHQYKRFVDVIVTGTPQDKNNKNVLLIVSTVVKIPCRFDFAILCSDIECF